MPSIALGTDRMQPTPESLPRLTATEYLKWEGRQDVRHELVDGYLYAMTGASLRHDEIAMNIAAALHSHLRGKDRRVYKSDVKVQIADNFYYPDIEVWCGRGQAKTNKYSLDDPKVIVEVLSPSTQRYDRGDKRLAYQNIKSLNDYILVSQDSVHVEQFRADGEIMKMHSEKDTLSIEALQFSMPLSEIYR